MALITFLGGDETGNVALLPWGRYVFEFNKAVKCNDRHIINKASANRFFKVEEDNPPPPDRMAAARAARAAKKAAKPDAA